jgi:hypothetical protein
VKYTLDPLLRFFTTHYVDDTDLRDRLQRLFKASRPPQLSGFRGNIPRLRSIHFRCRVKRFDLAPDALRPRSTLDLKSRWRRNLFSLASNWGRARRGEH